MTKDVKVFVRPSLDREKLTNKDLSDLITDFKKYKSGEKVHYFGKDVPYHEPRPYAENAGLRHVHILDKIKSLKLGHSNTSDSALVYTEGATHPNTYFIIDFIDDNAHNVARSHDYMNWLLSEAEKFRSFK